MNRKRWTRRLAWTVLLGCIAGSSAQAQQISAARLGCDLRSALGFGPRELAALGVDGNTYSSVATAATNYCGNNLETAEPLLASYRSARSDVFRAYEIGGDVASAEAALVNAISALTSTCGSAITTMDNLLTSEQRAQRARLADNRPLDAMLALLDLSSGQRSSLKSSQQTRDLTLRGHASRKDLPAVLVARDTFESAVNGALTAQQQTQRQALAAAMAQNLAAALAHDATLMQS